MPRPHTRLAAAVLPLLALPLALHAQSGGFVVTLGRDTVQVEQFTRTRDAVEGTVAYRAPSARFVRYKLQLGADGKPVRYEQSIFAPDGTPLAPNGANATLTFSADTATRETTRQGQPVLDRIATPDGVTPLLGSSMMIPFQYAFLTYELAFERARATQPAGETRLHLLSATAGQTKPQAARVWLVGRDSAEYDYFGVAKSGFRFDKDGRLTRSNWTQTTYKYNVARVASLDVPKIVGAWAALEKAGKPFGVYSPRDTTRADIGGAQVWVDYSRPSQRGRTIWGDVVPWGQVWRLGADMATQLNTDSELVIGETVVPAGKYSLWLLPTAEGASLVVNSQSGHFGTQYNPAKDFARIPMEHSAQSEPAEKLTIGLADGWLRVMWGNAGYAVAVRRR